MTRTMIRARDPEQFQQAKALLDGQVPVFVTSERRLFLSAGDMPEAVQAALRAAGLRVSVERPLYAPDVRAAGGVR